MEQKNTEISERIFKVLDFLNVKPQQFAKQLGYSRPQMIYDVLKGKAKPSFDFWERFFNSEYSERINGSWLITGKGPMEIFPNTGTGMVVVNEPGSMYGDFQTEIQRLTTELSEAKQKLLESEIKLKYSEDLFLKMTSGQDGHNKKSKSA